MSKSFKPLLVFAMKEESREVFADYEVLHTGIGKINAVYNLMRYIGVHGKPDIVVNMGTAGSRRFGGGTVVNPHAFVQRDMDVTFLGVEPYKTPFSPDPVTLKYGMKALGLEDGICGTGDNFDATERVASFDVVDMEAYALALVCKRENIPFLCLKYISDGADDNAEGDWRAALHHAAEVLCSTFERVLPAVESLIKETV